MWKLSRRCRRNNQRCWIQRLVQLHPGQCGRRRLHRGENPALVAPAPAVREVQQVRVVFGISQGVEVGRGVAGVVGRNDDGLGLARRRGRRRGTERPQFDAVAADEAGQLAGWWRGWEIGCVLGKT